MELKERLAKLSEANKGRFEQLDIDKNRWINEVKNLYRDIEDWFSEYISQEFLIIDYHTLKDAECEEFIMETSIMELKLGGGPSVFLEPTGINIVGTGRCFDGTVVVTVDAALRSSGNFGNTTIISISHKHIAGQIYCGTRRAGAS